LGVEVLVEYDLDRAEDASPVMPATGALFGREPELGLVSGLLDGEGPRAVVLAGDAGVGKTAIWREVVGRARRRGWLVSTAMASGAEVQLTFAALGDLVGQFGGGVLGGLPVPQRRALEVALLRADGPDVDARAVGSALLGMLRGLAAQRPLLLGIDDLQWLDPASREALAFALRRIDLAPVVVLATCRSPGEGRMALDLEPVLGAERVARVDVGPLTLAAVQQLLFSRLGFDPPRAMLVRLFEAAGGNPFFALELARELVRRGARVAPGASLAVPVSVRELIAARVARLPAEVGELLLAAGGLARPTVGVLERIRPDAAASVGCAVDAGLVELGSGGVISFSHPLLARVTYEGLEPAQRRRLHARLARVVDDAEERARHGALAAWRPSAGVALELDRAAVSAGARGAPGSAAELCRLAARLTPASCSEARWARSLAAAEWHERAGEIDQAAALTQTLLGASGPDGETRARALSLLASSTADSDGAIAAGGLYHRALREPGASGALRAEIHHRLSWLRLGAGDARAADRHARAALRLAAGRAPAVEASAAGVAALVDVVRGRPLQRDLLFRARSLEDALTARRAAAGDALPGVQGASGLERAELGPGYWPETAPAVIEGVALLWAGELEEAQAPLERVLAGGTERVMAGDAERVLAGGTERDEPWLVMHSLACLSALAIGLGELEHALALARRYLELADRLGQAPQRAAALWPVALAAAWLGHEQEARTAANTGLELAQASGYTLYAIGCLAALGLLELSVERHHEAAGALHRARRLADGSGIRALGRVPLLPNLVEALIACGELDHAAELAVELDRRAAVLGAPWAQALAHRCEGQLAEAVGDRVRAIHALERGLSQHAKQDRPLERARTELALGVVLRGAQQKRPARETLQRSLRTFQAAGARLWARRALRELGRIGGRAATPEGQLSATETSIAQLTQTGRTNHEIARALHLSPRTVEWNLSKIYRKLGVRSRTELAAKLQHPPGEPR
jgi:DNA-binding CsgD family transcriptional regulator